MDFSSISAHWLWLAGGILLLAAETMLPGVFLFWIGLAALGTGLILWAIPSSLTLQLVFFAILGLVSILLGRVVQHRQKGDATDAPFLNERGKGMVGKVYPLETAIVNGAGSVRIGDSVWRVAGDDRASGERVRVKAIDGGTLVVEAA
jgi:inner membrane protein